MKIKLLLATFAISMLTISMPVFATTYDNVNLLQVEESMNVRGRFGGDVSRDITITPAPGIFDQEAFLQQLNEFTFEQHGIYVVRGEDAGRAVSRTWWPRQLSAFQVRHVGSSTIDALLQTQLDRTNFITGSMAATGVADTMWSSATPAHMPTRVTLTNTMRATGVNVSISASGPNWQTQGNAVVWSDTRHNTWFIRHIYHGIPMNGLNLHFHQEARGDFLIGGTTHSISAFASALL